MVVYHYFSNILIQSDHLGKNMRFVSKYMFSRPDLYPWSNDGVCGLLSGLLSLCVNIIVLALVLSSIDYYFEVSNSVSFERMLRINVIVAASGLMIIRVISIMLTTMRASVLFSGFFALFVSACFVFYLKYNYINEFHLVFNYSAAVFILDIYLVLSLRASLFSYGVKCR